MQPTEEDRYRIMRGYYSMLMERGDHDCVGKMKQFATYFTHGVRGGAALRRSVYHCQRAEEIVSQVDRFFEEQLAVLA